jgi:transposase
MARSPSRNAIAAGDGAALLRCIEKAKSRCGLDPQARVRSCYEAGRDGWWIHRWLLDLGIDNIVVDSSSIEVNRRKRRAKTDRIDADKLLGMLMRYHGGERKVWSVVVTPSVEQEDQRRVERELQSLVHERTRHTNRIGSLLALQGLRPPRIAGREWEHWWADCAGQLPRHLRGQIEREIERLKLLVSQLLQLRRQQRDQQAGEQRSQVIAMLMQLRGLGLDSSCKIAHELFWRHFDNRRQVASCVGLTPMPYDSGESSHEQGISKTGSSHLRTLLVQLSWMWLRLQPDSELTLWFAKRFAAGGKRSRRIGIVALARRLVVALWRYVESGQIPAGAHLKPAAARNGV